VWEDMGMGNELRKNKKTVDRITIIRIKISREW
jgi:hypothetical protein